MKEAWIIVCGGFRGSEVYPTEKEAREAADIRRRISGQPWKPQKILIGYGRGH